MIVDDRLETVLRTTATGRLPMRIQFRQLADLLGRGEGAPSIDAAGSMPASPVRAAALERLDAIATALGEADCAALLRSGALRSRALVWRFVAKGPALAMAAVAGARLDEAAWLALIPELPIEARGALRHRRDLGARARDLLARLGVGDFALPEPDGYVPEAISASPARAIPLAAPAGETPALVARPGAPEPAVADLVLAEPARAEPAAAREGIGAIVRRIEAFRRHREGHPPPRSESEAASWPHESEAEPAAPEPHAPRVVTAIDIRIDAEGMIVAADAVHAPMLVGHRPFTGEVDAPATCDAETLRAFRARLPVQAGLMTFEGTAPVAGSWRVDAMPSFAREGGHYTGYHARLRRPEPARGASAANDDEGDSSTDRLRQLLHELRTPINAIQGFAELIQQQIFGPTPHQYRSLAASIASDAARMLAGFEEVERLARLETGQVEHESGETDLCGALTRLVAQLDPAIGPREVRLRLALPEAPVIIAVEALELERMLWRMLSVIAASAAPGERLALSLGEGAGYAHLVLPLPAALAMRDDAALFAPDSRAGAASPTQAMLGNGFALRLAAAEVRSVGGHLARSGARLMVDLPLGGARPAASPERPRGAA
ncbi:sensor histidine kinase [Novosphingobium huizhouense]|uniref:sensor histidine kinase n=1 Tax=Novosphingobium huizhouense TaxID=2866625 RepID=UPI001CD8AC72|nr:histidine kinase dimerization/phospho-acceptor domain-containing protein [Novosphingobium huizhouense]